MTLPLNIVHFLSNCLYIQVLSPTKCTVDCNAPLLSAVNCSHP